MYFSPSFLTTLYHIGHRENQDDGVDLEVEEKGGVSYLTSLAKYNLKLLKLMSHHLKFNCMSN